MGIGKATDIGDGDSGEVPLAGDCLRTNGGGLGGWEVNSDHAVDGDGDEVGPAGDGIGACGGDGEDRLLGDVDPPDRRTEIDPLVLAKGSALIEVELGRGQGG